jgi:hypothetical protein
LAKNATGFLTTIKLSEFMQTCNTLFQVIGKNCQIKDFLMQNSVIDGLYSGLAWHQNLKTKKIKL